jgi:TonB family protein
MDTEKFLLSIKDSLAFVVDRSVSPERVVGQACLLSKGRVATAASVVSNYVDAPWALAIKFPHPGMTFGVRAITLNPNFDRQIAKNYYQSLTGLPITYETAQENDIATLTLEEVLSELNADQLLQLNNDLSIPLAIVANAPTGKIGSHELAQLLQKVLSQGTNGLLTLLDARNIPVARLSINSGRIDKAIYNTQQGEMAVFELFYRKPAQGFHFQSPDPFSWGQTREITASAQDLINEALRRAQQVPTMINSFGGAQARYQRRIDQFDAKKANQNIAWVEEKLWADLDGYLTLDTLPERIGCDTYTTVYAIQDLVNQGLIGMRTTAPFTNNKQLGPPLMPAPAAKVWDAVLGVYLDPLSGKPIAKEGNFFGPARMQDQKALLHTVSLPPEAKGAPILKDKLLVGIHSGDFVPAPDQTQLPGRLYQMIWFGALQETSQQRIRPGEKDLTSEPEAADANAVTYTNLFRQQERPAPQSGVTCPACGVMNITEGQCVSCGTDLPVSQAAQEAAGGPANKLRNMPSTYGLSKKQIIIGVAIVLLISLFLMFSAGHNPPAKTVSQPTATTTSVAASKNSDKARAVAEGSVGFKGALPSSYYYVDTSGQTNGMPSFGIESESSNQKILIVVWNNISPFENLDLLTRKIPDTDYVPLEEPIVDHGESLVNGQPLKWEVAHYQHSTPPPDPTANNPNPQAPPPQMVLVGAYQHPSANKAIVVIARPYDANTQSFDYKTTLWLIDTLASGQKSPATVGGESTPATTSTATDTQAPAETTTTTTATTTQTKPAAPEKATPEALNAYAKQVQDLVLAKLQMPEEGQKAKLTVTFGLSEDGKLSKLEISTPSGNDTVDQAAIKALTDCQPYPKPPQTSETVLLFNCQKGKCSVKPG